MRDVAVIIPAYNSARYLPESIESVLNQTYNDFKLIIVDDGSTDDTQRVLEPYKDRISYIYQKNGGPSKARNTGIMATERRYIAFLDADDLWVPNKLEMQMELMNSNTTMGLVFSDAELFEEGGFAQGSFWRLRGCYEEMMRECRMIHSPFSKLMVKNFILPSAALVKRECFLKVGLFDESFRYPVAEDKDMWLRIAVHFSMGCVPYALIKRRVHAYTPEEDARIKRSVIDVVKKMEKIYPELIEKEKVDTKAILGPLYYSLGRTYLDQNQMMQAKESLFLSLCQVFSIRSVFYLMICLSGLGTLTFLRRIKTLVMS